LLLLGCQSASGRSGIRLPLVCVRARLPACLPACLVRLPCSPSLLPREAALAPRRSHGTKGRRAFHSTQTDPRAHCVAATEVTPTMDHSSRHTAARVSDLRVGAILSPDCLILLTLPCVCCCPAPRCFFLLAPLFRIVAVQHLQQQQQGQAVTPARRSLLPPSTEWANFVPLSPWCLTIASQVGWIGAVVPTCASFLAEVSLLRPSLIRFPRPDNSTIS
jgi:hypothetical protein